jgi:tetratricopeptide (TPR) repeat protein
MARTDDSDTPLQELLGRYLERQAAAHAAGFGLPDAGDEVVPYDAVPAQPIDARLAWDEAAAALRCFQPGLQTRSWKAPPEWPALVAAHEPETALPFCAGNFPQLVRHLHTLMQAADATSRPAARPVEVPALAEWARQAAQKEAGPQVLLAAGALRLARQYDEAADLLRQAETKLAPEWRTAWANEEAALLWQRGRLEEALASWQKQAASVPVLFNRGMAALFLGRPAEARTALRQATEQLPESNPWHHLGRLYLALAEMRG